MRRWSDINWLLSPEVGDKKKTSARVEVNENLATIVELRHLCAS